MRNYIPIKPETLPEPKESDFHSRLREKLVLIDYFLQDASFGFNRIIIGENPNGSGDPIGGDVDGGVFLKLAGRSGGQIAHGGTSASSSLTLASTADGTKGKVYLGDSQGSAFDEALGWFGVGTASPLATLHVSGSAANDLTLRPVANDILPDWDWRGQDEGTEIWSYVDEVTEDDNDYIKIRVGNLDFQNQISMRMLLNSPSSTPASTNTHVLRVAARRTGAGAASTLSVAMHKGTSGTGSPLLTGTWINAVLTSSFVVYTVTLSAAQITALGDYQNLIVWVNWSGIPAGSGQQVQVAWIELDCGQATTLTDIARFDDGGVGAFPSWAWNSAMTGTLPGASTDTQDTNIRLQLKTSDSINVFSIKGDASTIINVPQTTYTTGNPVGLSVIMEDSTAVSGDNDFFKLRTNGTDILTVGYFGLTQIDMTINDIGMVIDQNSGATSDYMRFNDGSVAGNPRASVVKGRIDSNGAYGLVAGAAVGSVYTCTSATTGVGAWTAVGALTASFADNLFSIFDNSLNTRIAAFELDGLTAGTHTYRPPPSTAATTITLAAIDLAQTFTKAQTITPDTDTTALTLNDSGAGQTTPMFAIAETAVNQIEYQTSVGAAGLAGLHFASNSAGGIPGLYLWPSGQIGVGFPQKFASLATKAVTFTFPNFIGVGLVRAAALDIINQTASKGVTTFLGASNVLAGTIWFISCYIACKVAAAGSSVSTSIRYTDVNSVSRDIQIASCSLASTTAPGFSQGTLVIETKAGVAIQYFTTLVGTGTYDNYLRLNAS